MAESTEQELIRLTQQLLDSIAQADWKTYSELCDPTLSCFEPEAVGHLVQGMDFHRYYFDLGAGSGPRNTTLSSPHVSPAGRDGYCQLRATNATSERIRRANHDSL